MSTIFVSWPPRSDRARHDGSAGPLTTGPVALLCGFTQQEPEGNAERCRWQGGV